VVEVMVSDFYGSTEQGCALSTSSLRQAVDMIVIYRTSGHEW